MQSFNQNYTLKQAATSFGVSKEEIIFELNQKGFDIENNDNAILDEEMYEVIYDRFYFRKLGKNGSSMNGKQKNIFSNSGEEEHYTVNNDEVYKPINDEPSKEEMEKMIKQQHDIDKHNEEEKYFGEIPNGRIEPNFLDTYNHLEDKNYIKMIKEKHNFTDEELENYINTQKEEQKKQAAFISRVFKRDIEPEENEEMEIEIPFNPNDIKVRTQHLNIGDLVDRLEHNEIKMDTEFQRLAHLWNDTKKSRFIESLLLRLPIPTFYFDETKNSVFKIISNKKLKSVLNYNFKYSDLMGIDYGNFDS